MSLSINHKDFAEVSGGFPKHVLEELSLEYGLVTKGSRYLGNWMMWTINVQGKMNDATEESL